MGWRYVRHFHGRILLWNIRNNFQEPGTVSMLIIYSADLKKHGRFDFEVIFLHFQIMYAVYGGLMALIFMVFLAIDTQMLVGGKRIEMDPEEYIFAATQLFLDIIYIFWFILQLLGLLNNRSVRN